MTKPKKSKARKPNAETYVYIAGPYSKGDVAQNVRTAVIWAEHVKCLGFQVFVPHLCHLWHLISPHSYLFWMDHDLAWLKKCDILLRMPGDSEGADREVAAAKALGIPVVTGLEGLKELV